MKIVLTSGDIAQLISDNTNEIPALRPLAGKDVNILFKAKKGWGNKDTEFSVEIWEKETK